MYVWMCCEGWVRFGPYEWVGWTTDRRVLVDQNGQLIAQESGAHWQSALPEFANFAFDAILITHGPRHPPPRHGGIQVGASPAPQSSPIADLEGAALEAAVQTLERAILSYNHVPLVCTSIAPLEMSNAANATEAEAQIRQKLSSALNDDIRHGLANVLAWKHTGQVQIGRVKHRIGRFLDEVDGDQLTQVGQIARDRGEIDALIQVQLPQFGHDLAMISRVMAFLRPDDRVVIDSGLRDLARVFEFGPLGRITPLPAMIPTSRTNLSCYHEFCWQCRSVGDRWFGARYRAVDVQRGLNLLACRNSQGRSLCVALLATMDRVAPNVPPNEDRPRQGGLF